MVENIDKNKTILEIVKSLNKRQIELIDIMLQHKIKVDLSIGILSEPPKNLNNQVF